MKIAQKQWTAEDGWRPVSPNGASHQAQLALVFGDLNILRRERRMEEIRQSFPHARIVGCSTAGEILGDRVFDNSITATGVCFEDTQLQFTQTTVEDMEDSYHAGIRLADALDPNGLVHVFVLSDGLNVNGSALAKGLHGRLPGETAVTGGLAGDQGQFKETAVFLDTVSDRKTLVAIGFYGKALQVRYGSRGGWDSFGPDRVVTKSKANVVYELDGQSVLQLYKRYLGEQADGLPATGLLFPLSLAINDRQERLVRTILAVNEDDGSMTFAGDVPEGSLARLMKANFECLVEGAADSARQCRPDDEPSPALAMLVSCVGRKLVLKQRVDEEVESVRNTLGRNTATTGFYSYGEICPVGQDRRQAELHNQTMTITTFSERLSHS
ncbi:MAG: FIST N-terminal domain-containing protein [Phycisphaerales bacterium]